MSCNRHRDTTKSQECFFFLARLAELLHVILGVLQLRWRLVIFLDEGEDGPFLSLRQKTDVIMRWGLSGASCKYSSPSQNE